MLRLARMSTGRPYHIPPSLALRGSIDDAIRASLETRLAFHVVGAERLALTPFELNLTSSALSIGVAAVRRASPSELSCPS